MKAYATWVFERSCLNKRMYRSRREAKLVAISQGRTLRPYRCEFCGYWHCATKPNHRSDAWHSRQRETS